MNGRRSYALILGGVCLAQAAVWVALAGLLEGSIRLDVAEGVVDGPQSRLSYLRHPPFSSWLTGLATHAGALRYVAVYAIGLALSCGAFALVALFMRRRAGERAGWVALCAGLASPYATYVPLQVNHNIGVMPFWALVLAAAWSAFANRRLVDWALLGVAVGLGLWAKYAILHLMVPLALYYLAAPDWRRRALAPGPWLAMAIALIVVAPHLIDVLANGATTVRFASRTEAAPLAARALWIGEFALDCALAQGAMAILAVAAGGRDALRAALRPFADLRHAPALQRYLAVAAFGPVALVLSAALLGVRPHYLWLTPFALSFAAYWGFAASQGEGAPSARLWRVFAALSFVALAAYVGVREGAPAFAARANYVEMDGPALARLAQSYWAERHSGRIPFLVSLGLQHSFQAAGSIAFDLPYRVETLEEGEPKNSPWFDVAALRARGALVVSIAPIAPGTAILGGPIVDIERFDRPMMRGARSEAIYFGEVRGTSNP